MVRIQGGDFRPGSTDLTSGALTLISAGPPERTEKIEAGRLQSLEILASEGGGRNRAIAKALVGSLVFGPVAGLAAISALRSKHEVTFIARLEDGRHFVATSDDKTFASLKAAAKGARRISRIDREEDREAELSAGRADELVARYRASLPPCDLPARAPVPPTAAPRPLGRPTFGKR